MDKVYSKVCVTALVGLLVRKLRTVVCASPARVKLSVTRKGTSTDEDASNALVFVLPCTEHITVLVIQKPYNLDFAKANVITLSTYAGSGSMSLGGGVNFGWVAYGA